MGVLQESMTETPTKAHSEKHRRESDLYMMSHSEGYIKVGISNNPTTRREQIDSMCPHCNVGLASVFFIPEHIDTKKVENTVHEELDNYNVRGEWFDMPLLEAENKIIEIVEDYKENTPEGGDIDQNVDVDETDILELLESSEGPMSMPEISDKLDVGRAKCSRPTERLERAEILFTSTRRAGIKGRPPKVYEINDWVEIIHERKESVETLAEAAKYAYENDIDRDLLK